MSPVPRSLTPHPALDRARDDLARLDPETLDLQAELSAIPAPTGAEAPRARRVEGAMRGFGLDAVTTDMVGNVCGWWGPPGSAPALVVAAHLDTVFGPEVDVAVRRNGRRMWGPGIADNARGLAGMLALARVIAAGQWRTTRPIAFVSTVGEEGAGDLRGVKHLFEAGAVPTHALIALDGAGDDRVVHGALGCRRYRVTFRGPGGHSWSAFGVANPAHAAGALVNAVAELPRPQAPRTTCSVVGLAGGSSLNSIPEETRVEIDLRSEDAAAIPALEVQLRAQALEAARAESARGPRGSAPLEVTVEVIGHRPAGRTPADHPLVQAAVDATRAIGREPVLATASTDANVPISLGIPAIALGAGGKAGEAHRTTEWYENADGPLGLFRVLLVIAAAAGLG